MTIGLPRLSSGGQGIAPWEIRPWKSIVVDLQITKYGQIVEGCRYEDEDAAFADHTDCDRDFLRGCRFFVAQTRAGY